MFDLIHCIAAVSNGREYTVDFTSKRQLGSYTNIASILNCSYLRFTAQGKIM